MVIAFVSLAGNAALIKKIGGAVNTRLHGYTRKLSYKYSEVICVFILGSLMSAATALAGFAFYVIYSNKGINHKKHLTTVHGKLGAAVLVGYTGLAIAGAVALHPDFGVLRTNKTVRAIHKWGGRFLTAAAWFVSVLGFITMQKSLVQRVAFGAPLLVGGFYVLL